MIVTWVWVLVLYPWLACISCAVIDRLTEHEAAESERQAADMERADRSIFIHELLLSSLSHGLRIEDETDEGVDILTLSTPSSGESEGESAAEPSPQPPPQSDDSSAPSQNKQETGDWEGGGDQKAPDANNCSPCNPSPCGGRQRRGAAPQEASALPLKGVPAAASKGDRVNSSANHRSMVKHKDASRKPGREPPPNNTKAQNF